MKTELLSTVLRTTPGGGPVQTGTARGQVAESDTRALPVARAADFAAALGAERETRLAEVMERVAETLNLGDTAVSRKLRFQYDRSINVSVIEVYDSETEELIRQIPSEEVLKRMRDGVSDGLPLIDTLA